jgi:hypothetical protein
VKDTGDNVRLDDEKGQRDKKESFHPDSLNEGLDRVPDFEQNLEGDPDLQCWYVRLVEEQVVMMRLSVKCDEVNQKSKPIECL